MCVCVCVVREGLVCVWGVGGGIGVCGHVYTILIASVLISCVRLVKGHHHHFALSKLVITPLELLFLTVASVPQSSC